MNGEVGKLDEAFNPQASVVTIEVTKLVVNNSIRKFRLMNGSANESRDKLQTTPNNLCLESHSRSVSTLAGQHVFHGGKTKVGAQVCLVITRSVPEVDLAQSMCVRSAGLLH